MPKIDFLISNNGHHTAMILPVVDALAGRAGYQCRVVSLCEFRGLTSPVEKFRMNGVVFDKVLPFKLRSSPSVGRQTGNAKSRTARQIARRVSWQVLLGPRLRSCLQSAADLLILPNDTAFPYNHICQSLQARRIPFLLIQEGIRFPLPGTAGTDAYGRGGAVAIAAWGESSADYFRRQGVPDEIIHQVGNPRFDVILKTDWRSEANRLREQWKFGKRNLLFLSNPIDDQGFCTTQEKLALVRRFLVGLTPLFDDPDFHLIIKLHTRESMSDFQSLLVDLAFAGQVTILGACPLYPLFTLSQAAIVLASTVGLEALLYDVPLGVLEIPRFGFVYDYVSSGVAMGLNWDASIADQVKALLEFPSYHRSAVRQYVARNLVTRGTATDRVVKLIIDLVQHGPKRTEQPWATMENAG